MAEKIYNALFLCTGNTARSILGEALLNAAGKGRFRAYSAGSHPKGHVHPLAIELLRKNNLPTGDLRSKDWSEFAQPGAPQMDFIFTVCDNAAGEACPVWLGKPVTAHWGVADPAAVEGSQEERREAFFRTYMALANRIALFVSVPIEHLDKLALGARLEEIGRVRQ
ncbi:MAG TPA: arsenate reductase ArsC [Burkholderiales bacterium]|nr:arsenate reductase ArsC [Burkholderiales bacterium]